MSPSDAKLAALIGSRICHDLISPIGAINNGLELLTLTGAEQSPEMDLIAQSVGNASARIRFFRVAFGAAGDQQVAKSEISEVLASSYDTGRITVEYAVSGAQPRNMVRLAFLAVLCAETALPYGGRIRVTQEEGIWQIEAVGEKLNVDSALWSQLVAVGHDSDLSPAQVQFGLLPTLARSDGLTLHTDLEPTRVRIRF